MIAPLRRVHRFGWPAVGVATAALFVVALQARPEWPVEGAADAGTADLELVDQSLGLSVRDGEVIAVDREGPHAPDRLLYWSAEVGADALPPGARLLGPVGGPARRYTLPEGETGSLFLYSLGHGELLAALPLPLARPGRDD